MNRKIFMTVLVAAIAVCAFSGIGYAFTAMTYNLDNNAEVEYVVLAQDNFTFNDDARLQYYSLTDNSTGGKVLYYMINAGYDEHGDEIPLTHMGERIDGSYRTLDGKNYWGMKIGSSNIEVNLVNPEEGNPVISIPMGGFVKNNGSWRYFLNVYHKDGEGHLDYSEWLWSKGNGWNNFDLDPSKINPLPAEQQALEKQKIQIPRGEATSYTVTVELYFAAPAQSISAIGRTVAGGNPVAGSFNDMPAYNASTYKLMDEAWIRYVYDSDVDWIYYPDP